MHIKGNRGCYNRAVDVYFLCIAFTSMHVMPVILALVIPVLRSGKIEIIGKYRVHSLYIKNLQMTRSLW